MSRVTLLSRRIRSAAQRQSLDRALVDVHPAVRDEVLTRWEAQAR